MKPEKDNFDEPFVPFEIPPKIREAIIETLRKVGIDYDEVVLRSHSASVIRYTPSVFDEDFDPEDSETNASV